MPRQANPKPHQEIPSYEVLNALRLFFEDYKEDPFAKHLLQRLIAGEKLWKEEVEEDWKVAVAGADKPAPTLATMLAPIKNLTRTLFDLLTQGGHADKVKEVKKKYTDPYDIAVNAIKACQDVNLDVAASVVAALQKQLRPYAEAKARVDAGGHPVFDKKLAALATKLWILVDDGFDGAKILLRDRGLTTHPLFDLYPTVKTPLRPVVGPAKPATTSKRNVAKASKDEKAKRNVLKTDAKGAKGKGKDDSSHAGGTPPAPTGTPNPPAPPSPSGSPA